MCMKFKPVFDKVLGRIRPSPDERELASSRVDAFISLLDSELRRLRIKAKVVPGGSFAKDTWLSGDFDVDVFVKFDLKYEGRKDISDLLESALLHFHPERVHGSRDYFRVRDEVSFEIVPVLDIKHSRDARNVTDFSPLHVAWVNRHGLKDDIRLAKKFCKAARCYGAESYIRGFSGHVLDILVIHFGGFLKLLRAALKWKPQVVIDTDDVYEGRALFHLNKSKVEGPLVVVDPVQPDRNAAAALDAENFDRFVDAASKFLKSPSGRFFVEKKFDPSRYALLVKVATLDAKEDVAGAKMVRAFEHVRDVISAFGVKDSGWQWDKKGKAFWWFKVKHDILHDTFQHRGPPLDMGDHVAEFRSQYDDTFVRDGFVWAVVEREHTDIREAISAALKDRFVRERVKSARLA